MTDCNWEITGTLLIAWLLIVGALGASLWIVVLVRADQRRRRRREGFGHITGGREWWGKR